MRVDARLEELKQDLAHQLSGPRTWRRGEQVRGREADHPDDIPPNGWKDIARRAWREISDQNLFLIAGGVTYAVLLALFPGLAALVSLYGLVFDTSQIEQQVAALTGVLPAQTQELLSQELHSLVESSNGTLGFAAVVGLFLAFWTASRGMSGLMTAINIAYEEEERRSLIRFNLIAIGMTLGLMVGGVLAIALIAILPAVVQLLAVGPTTRWVLLIVQWPLLILIVMLGLAVLYRFGPDRDEPQWRWASPGAITATIFWIIASLGFTTYVANFNSYGKTYGSLGGVVILLTWLYLSALMVLLGAVINAQSERRTRRGPTDGAQPANLPDRAMAGNAKLDRLKRRLRWEGAGPLAQLSSGATAALMARGREIVTRVRTMTEERPLTSLWFAFQIGLAAGRWGPRRAKH